jgi:hypothetical protein
VDYLEDVGPGPAEKAAPLEGDSDRPLVPLAVRDLRVEFPTDDVRKELKKHGLWWY